MPLNDLPRVARDHDEFVVIGAGKTGMDACIWLLGHGVDPERIRWIVPRDSWILNRANVQPGEEFFAAFCKSLADQVEALAEATSVDDVFARLEAAGELRRIDPAVTPEAYHSAILSDGELAELRRIRNVVRLGHVTAIDRERDPPRPGHDHHRADMPAHRLLRRRHPRHPSKPVFDGDRITLQWVRTCQPTFSAALIGFVESTFADDDVKNRICTPIAPPSVPLDWLRMMQTSSPTASAGASTPRSTPGWRRRGSIRSPRSPGHGWVSMSRPPGISSGTCNMSALRPPSSISCW